MVCLPLCAPFNKLHGVSTHDGFVKLQGVSTPDDFIKLHGVSTHDDLTIFKMIYKYRTKLALCK